MKNFAIIEYISDNIVTEFRYLAANNQAELCCLLRLFVGSVITVLTNKYYNGPASLEEMVSFVDTSIKLNNEFFKRDDRININVFI